MNDPFTADPPSHAVVGSAFFPPQPILDDMGEDAARWTVGMVATHERIKAMYQRDLEAKKGAITFLFLLLTICFSVMAIETMIILWHL
jgi:hypothetical protein